MDKFGKWSVQKMKIFQLLEYTGMIATLELPFQVNADILD